MTNTTNPIDEADEQIITAMRIWHIEKQVEKDLTPAHL